MCIRMCDATVDGTKAEAQAEVRPEVWHLLRPARSTTAQRAPFTSTTSVSRLRIHAQDEAASLPWTSPARARCVKKADHHHSRLWPVPRPCQATCASKGQLKGGLLTNIRNGLKRAPNNKSTVRRTLYLRSLTSTSMVAVNSTLATAWDTADVYLVAKRAFPRPNEWRTSRRASALVMLPLPCRAGLECVP